MKTNTTQQWIRITFLAQTDGVHPLKLDQYDLPLEVYQRRKWVIRWKLAKLQCQFPKLKCYSLYCYYQKMNVPLEICFPLLQLQVARNKVKRLYRRINQLKTAYQQTRCTKGYQNDPYYQKLVTLWRVHSIQVACLNQQVHLRVH